jgi:prepilin-type N-terminal cleavage/methylation domain-containing protein
MKPADRLHRLLPVRGEEGFTLPELLMVVVISSVIVLVLASAFIVGARTTSEAKTRLEESRDARLLATYFGSDVGSVESGGIAEGAPLGGSCWAEPLRTAGYDGPELRFPSTALARLHWSENGRSRDAWYVQPDARQGDGTWAPSTFLVRRLCEEGPTGAVGVGEEVRVLRFMRSADLACHPDAGCGGDPSRVEMTVRELSGYEYTVRAFPRSTGAAQIVGAPPRVEGIRRSPAKEATNAAAVRWEVWFSAEVTGVSLNDFNLVHSFGSPSPVLSISPSFPQRRSRLWTVTATTTSAQQEGTLRLDLFDDDFSIKAQDLTPLDDGSVTGETFRLDKVRPSVVLARAPGQGVSTRTLPVRYTATFNEPVLDFGTDDVTCTGCDGGTVSVSGTGPVYDIVVESLPAAATVRLSIPDGRVADEAGNLNTASAVVPVNYDPALVVVESITRHPDDGELANLAKGSVRWVVTFSQPVRDVNATGGGSDFVVARTGSLSGNVPLSSTPTSSTLASTWTVTADLSSLSGAGTLGLELRDNDSIRTGPGAGQGSLLGGSGTFGNGPGDGSFVGPAYDVDRRRPTPTVALAPGQEAATGTLPVRFAVNFDEPVTGFAAADVVRSGGGGGATIAVNQTGVTSYEVTLAGISTGTTTISVAAGAATDAAGNTSVVSNQVPVYYDPQVLRVVSINRRSAEVVEVGIVAWDVVFSEAVRRVNATGGSNDFALDLGGNLTGNIALGSSPGSSTFSDTWQVTADLADLEGVGTLRLDLVDNNSIETATGKRLGNPSVSGDGGFQGQAYLVDRTPPTVTALEFRNRVGGIAGKMEQGDQIIVTYSRRMQVRSFCSTWSNDESDQQILSNVSIRADNNGASGSDDEIEVSTTSGCTFNFGTIDLDDDDYVSTDRTFNSGAKIEWLAASRQLVLTLGTPSGSTLVETDAHRPTYNRDSDLRSSTGQSLPSSYRIPENRVAF